MLVLNQLSTSRAPHGNEATLTMTFDQRRKSRQRAKLDDGTDVAVMLERGLILRGGDVLLGEDGRRVLVRAALETVSTAHAADPVLLARAAYHLGNRHLPLQIGNGWVRYEHDHVLDHLAAGLGLRVMVEQAAFEPEAGSYAAASAPHSHGNASHVHD
jgi:urease accessory protein